MEAVSLAAPVPASVVESSAVSAAFEPGSRPGTAHRGLLRPEWGGELTGELLDEEDDEAELAALLVEDDARLAREGADAALCEEVDAVLRLLEAQVEEEEAGERAAAVGDSDAGCLGADEGQEADAALEALLAQIEAGCGGTLDEEVPQRTGEASPQSERAAGGAAGGAEPAEAPPPTEQATAPLGHEDDAQPQNQEEDAFHGGEATLRQPPAVEERAMRRMSPTSLPEAFQQPPATLPLAPLLAAPQAVEDLQDSRTRVEEQAGPRSPSRAERRPAPSVLPRLSAARAAETVDTGAFDTAHDSSGISTPTSACTDALEANAVLPRAEVAAAAAAAALRDDRLELSVRRLADKVEHISTTLAADVNEGGHMRASSGTAEHAASQSVQQAAATLPPSQTAAGTEDHLLAALRASSATRQRQEAADWETFRGAIGAAQRRVEAAEANADSVKEEARHDIEEARVRAERAEADRSSMLERVAAARADAAAAVARADAAERRLAALEREKLAWEEERVRLQAEVRTSAFNVASARGGGSTVLGGLVEARMQRLEDRFQTQQLQHSNAPPLMWVSAGGGALAAAEAYRPATAPGLAAEPHAQAASATPGGGSSRAATPPTHAPISAPAAAMAVPMVHMPTAAPSAYSYYAPLPPPPQEASAPRWEATRAGSAGAATGRYWAAPHSAQLEEAEDRAMRRARARGRARATVAEEAAEAARARVRESVAIAHRDLASGAVARARAEAAQREAAAAAEVAAVELRAAAVAAETERERAAQAEAAQAAAHDEAAALARVRRAIAAENVAFQPKRGAFRGWKVQQREEGTTATPPHLRARHISVRRLGSGDEVGAGAAASEYERQLEGIRQQYFLQKREMGQRQLDAVQQQVAADGGGV